MSVGVWEYVGVGVKNFVASFVASFVGEQTADPSTPLRGFAAARCRLQTAGRRPQTQRGEGVRSVGVCEWE